jgi:hypothetical protein
MRAVAARRMLFWPEKLWQIGTAVPSLVRDDGMT